MSNGKSMNSYFESILDKFSYINCIIVTDIEGALIHKQINKSKNVDANAVETIKGSLNFLFHSASDQLLKTENDNVKTIITVFDSQTLIQAKVSNSFAVHVLCDSKECSIEMVKEIILDIGSNIASSPLEAAFHN